MNVQLNKYEKYSRSLKLLLVVAGLWPNSHFFFNEIVSRLAAASTFFICVNVANFCILNIANVMTVTKGIGTTISFFTSSLKVCIFLFHYDDLVYLNNHLSRRFEADLANSDDRPHLLTHLSLFSSFFYALSYTIATVTFASALPALATALRGSHYPQMLHLTYPFKYEPGGSVYWMLVCFELISSFFVWSVTCGVDSVFGFYTLQLCGELRILARRFEMLGSAKDYRTDLRECVERHLSLMKSKCTLERIFGFLAIWLAVTCAIVLCTLIFQVNLEFKSLSPFSIIFFVFYILLKMVQAFSYAYCGNLIFEESRHCLNAMYNAYWAGSGNKSLMNDVLIVLSQKPLMFIAKSCMLLEMDTFSKIMNTSISYFFLLRTLEEVLHDGNGFINCLCEAIFSLSIRLRMGSSTFADAMHKQQSIFLIIDTIESIKQ